MPTLAIPDYIVGDTETIERRLRDEDLDASIMASCAGERLAEFGDLGEYFTEALIAHAAVEPAMRRELARRRAARRMSSAIQPDGEGWR